MKTGLNYSDIRTLKRGLSAGWNNQQIARACRISDSGVVAKYIASMDPDEVNKLRTEAPVSDIEMLKEELKREILEEMRRGISSEEFEDDPQVQAFEEEEGDEEESAA